MANKRKTKSKRSLGAAPKGLIRGRADDSNPFEMTARQKRPKYEVHNRPVSKPKNQKLALENLQRRRTQLKSNLKSAKKSNDFIDRRIGQNDPTMSHEDQMVARLVRERTRQSQRTNKFRLDDEDDDGNNVLTHKGKRLDPNKTEAIYSDDEDEKGNLEAVDTERHFGGSTFAAKQDPYGGSSAADLSQIYGQRKTELDELIAHRRAAKAEKMQAKEAQVETVEKLDEGFAELSNLLKFRKDQKIVKPPKPTKEDEEMNEWHLEMKQMMMKPKRKATDRTKTPEEIAKEEAERLHELETRRLARMNGDFEEDDFSDISVDGNNNKKKKRSKKNAQRNPDELSDSEGGSDDEKLEPRMTSEGLRYFDGQGRMVDDEKRKGTPDVEPKTEGTKTLLEPLEVGSRVRGNYRAAEQFDGREAWYDGQITKVHKMADGSFKYDVEYDDGDCEEEMDPTNVRTMEEVEEQDAKPLEKSPEDQEAASIRQKAREKARNEIPFVFEVPTTLDALHDLIARYAKTGRDASTIIQRIHKANSVRLDHRNLEKMQNFNDVLLRRFMAVGDAIFDSGDGGEALGRHDQLNVITKVMYLIAHDSPESAGAVWSRRIGIIQNAHAKRLRDAEFVPVDDESGAPTAWPSTGTFLLLRALGHIFPVTDRRHYVLTPTILLLGQIISQTPVRSTNDVVIGILCSVLLLEYTKEAKRVAPEALAFLAGALKLFSPNPGNFAIPSLEMAYHTSDITSLRERMSGTKGLKQDLPNLRLEKNFAVQDSVDVSLAILSSVLDVIKTSLDNLKGSFSLQSEKELLAEITNGVLSLRPKNYPVLLQKKVSKVASALMEACPPARAPLCRRADLSLGKVAIKSLAPRMQNPERYSMSNHSRGEVSQTELDRTRRELKRERKAVSRELRLDAALIEKERRTEKSAKDAKAKATCQKNYAWLEGEQAAMNQQVRLGGSLLKGGGMGAAKAKVASAKLGIKKGGKF